MAVTSSHCSLFLTHTHTLCVVQGAQWPSASHHTQPQGTLLCGSWALPVASCCAASSERPHADFHPSCHCPALICSEPGLLNTGLWALLVQMLVTLRGTAWWPGSPGASCLPASFHFQASLAVDQLGQPGQVLGSAPHWSKGWRLDQRRQNWSLLRGTRRCCSLHCTHTALLCLHMCQWQHTGVGRQGCSALSLQGSSTWALP